MGINETDDSSPKPEGQTADFTSCGFSLQDQQEVFKRMSADRNHDVGGLDLDTTDSGGKQKQSGRRIDFPHSWYAGGASFCMPAEASVASIENTLKQGWSKLK